MITFLRNDGDGDCTLKVIIGAETIMGSVIDSTNTKISLDSYFNEVASNDNIRHIDLEVAFCRSEKEVHDFLSSRCPQNSCTKQTTKNDIYEEELVKNVTDKSEHHDHTQSYKCPICGSNEGLVDKDGNVHPCLTCLKIDIGMEIENKYNKTYKLYINGEVSDDSSN